MTYVALATIVITLYTGVYFLNRHLETHYAQHEELRRKRKQRHETAACVVDSLRPAIKPLKPLTYAQRDHREHVIIDLVQLPGGRK